MLLKGGMAFSQIPAELMTGNKKAALDLMFFRFFRQKDGSNTEFLFFSRNRTSVEYNPSKNSSLPQFGSTNALSWNPEFLKSLAPVFVCQVFSSGIFFKAGMQYAMVRKNMTLFSWLVCETKKEPNIDFFFLGRFTPALNKHFHLFAQLELIGAFPTAAAKNRIFTQRIRLGLKFREFQFGPAADFSQTGRNDFIASANTGGFLRYEF